MSTSRIRLILAAVALATALMHLIHAQSYVPFGTDFTQDYVAAQALRHGQPLYGNWGDEWTARNLAIPVVQNFHPPTMALIALPFSFLNHANAHTVWNVFSLIAYISAFVALCIQQRISPTAIACLVILLPFWNPVQVGQASANTSLLMASCLTLGWCALKQKQERVSGMLFAIPILMKIFPALLISVLIAQRRWRAVSSCILSVAIFAALTVAIIGIDDFGYFFTVRGPQDINEWGPHLLNQSLYGLNTLLFGLSQESSALYPSADLFLVTALMTSCLLGAIFAKRLISDWRMRKLSERTFSLAIITMLLLSPLTWCHGITMALAPLMLLGTKLRAIDRRAAVYGIIAFLLISAPDVQIAQMLLLHFGPPLHWLTALPAKLPVIGLCLLYGVALRIPAEVIDSEMTGA